MKVNFRKGTVSGISRKIALDPILGYMTVQDILDIDEYPDIKAYQTMCNSVGMTFDNSIDKIITCDIRHPDDEEFDWEKYWPVDVDDGNIIIKHFKDTWYGTVGIWIPAKVFAGKSTGDHVKATALVYLESYKTNRVRAFNVEIDFECCKCLAGNCYIPFEAAYEIATTKHVS